MYFQTYNECIILTGYGPTIPQQSNKKIKILICVQITTQNKNYQNKHCNTYPNHNQTAK